MASRLHINSEDILAELKDFSLDFAYFSFHRYRFEYLLHLLERYQSPGSRFLDIGSYHGFMMLGARQLGYDSVAGVDLKKSVDHSTAVSVRYGFDNRPADLRDGLPFPDNSFDLVLFSEVLEHLTFCPRTIFREISRVLRPEGKIILTTPNLCRLNNILSLLAGQSINWDIKEDYHENHHVREYAPAEISYLLAGAGLKEVESRFVNFPYPGLGLIVKITDLIAYLWKKKRRDIVIIAENPDLSL